MVKLLLVLDHLDAKKYGAEDDCGDQENPHPECSGFLLLLERFKVSVQFAGAMHALLLFLNQSLARLRPRTGQTDVRPNTTTQLANHLHEPEQAMALRLSGQDRAG